MPNLDGGNTVFSHVSLTGGLSVNTITAASTLSVGGTLSITSGFAVGGKTAFTQLYPTTVSIVTMTVTAQKSLTTTATVSGLSTVDYVMIAPSTSGLSDGITLDAWCSAANTLTVQFSNVSGTQAVQAGPVNYKILVIR